jgi:hypothetical protein
VEAFAWSHVLFGLVAFVVASVGGLAIVGLVLVTLPADYVSDARLRDFWVEKHPIIRWTGLILKNLLGAVAVALGVILSLPGVPGPGILTILIGIMLLDLPGKRRVERWLLSRPSVLGIINGLRRRSGKPPLDLDPAGKHSCGVGAGRRTPEQTAPPPSARAAKMTKRESSL